MFFDGQFIGSYSQSTECLQEIKNRLQRQATAQKGELPAGDKRICRLSMTECGIAGCNYAIHSATFSVYQSPQGIMQDMSLVKHNGKFCDKLNPDSLSSDSSA